MGRKRAAVLAPVVEEEEQQAPGNEIEPHDNGTVTADQADENEHAIISAVERQVHERIMMIRKKADEISIALQNEVKLQLLKLTKQEKTMTLMDYQARFGHDLSDQLLADIRARLELATGAPIAAPAGPAAVPCLGVAAGRAGRRRGMYKSEGSRTVLSKGTVLDTPGPAATARLPKAGETFYSENGSPLGQFHRQASGAAVLATPMVGGGVLTTPMLGPSNAAPHIPSATLLTLVKNTSKRKGARVKQPDTLLAMTTADGQQIHLDELKGLASLPAAQRKEVEEHLKQMQRLTASLLRK